MRSDITKVGAERAPHRALFKATGLCDEEISRPFIGVVNSFNEFIPGHIHLDKLAAAAKAGIRSAGGVPFEFQTIGVCDGIAMGHAGMRYSLPSRELIEDSIEIMAEAHQLDGLVMIPSCDKIVPGHIMAAGRLNLPTIVITGGPMMPGFACDKELDLINVFEGWQAGGEALSDLEEAACPGAGSCAGLFTANTMACLTEAMGLSLPGCATTHAVDARKIRIAKQSGMKIMELVERGLTARQIVTPAALDNAIRVDMAIGGSTNTVLHIPAIAAEFGLDLSLDRFDQLSRETPHLVNLRPGGPYHILDLDRAGGIPAVLTRLRSMLHLDAMTVTGKTPRRESASLPGGQSRDFCAGHSHVGCARAPGGRHSHIARQPGPGRSCGQADGRLRLHAQAHRPGGDLRLGGGVHGRHHCWRSEGRRCGSDKIRGAKGRPGHEGDIGTHLGHSRPGIERISGPYHRRPVQRRHSRPLHWTCLARGGCGRTHRPGQARRHDQH